MNILIKNADIVTSDIQNMVIKNVMIGITDGIIGFIKTDKFEEIEENDYEEVIDATNKLVIPGLINTHTHVGMTVFRNFAADIPLEDWLFNKIFPVEANLTPEDVYWCTLLGIGEMLRSGTTTFADMYYHMDYVAKAVTETGIRANLSKSVLSLNSDGVGSIRRDIKGVETYFKKWNGSSNDRIKVYVEIHSPYIYDESSLRDAAQIAKSLDTGIHIHVAETIEEQKTCMKKYGMNSVEILDKCGVFDVPTLAAHCIHLTDENIALLSKKKVNVSHNITSNLKLGSGIANIPKMLNKGINISLGTDGCASNDNLNMFEEMHLTALVHKGVNQNPTLLPADETVLMATKNGAKALGFCDEIGIIKEGAKADIILMSTDKIHYTPNGNHVLGLSYSAQASDVETVIVDGEILMKDKQLLTIDEELVKSKVSSIANRLIK